jgi:hypothetical protein
MPPEFWVASTKREGGLWRRVIAGQKPACIAGRGTYVTSTLRANHSIRIVTSASGGRR